MEVVFNPTVGSLTGNPQVYTNLSRGYDYKIKRTVDRHCVKFIVSRAGVSRGTWDDDEARLNEFLRSLEEMSPVGVLVGLQPIGDGRSGGVMVHYTQSIVK